MCLSFYIQLNTISNNSVSDEIPPIFLKKKYEGFYRENPNKNLSV